MKPKPLDCLTMARFFAASCVMVSHFHGQRIINAPALFDFLDGGRPAVAFFFVLSGFVMAYNYRELATRDAIQDFWIARLARLYPVHLLGLALAAVPLCMMIAREQLPLLESTFSLKRSYGVIGRHPITALDMATVALFIQLLLLSAWTPTARLNQPWNPPAWSISCEVFFYAVFPALLGPVSRASTRALFAGCILFWLAQGAWIAVLQHSGGRGFLISQFPLTHVFEFVLGVVLAEAYKRHDLHWLRQHPRVVLASCAAFATGMGLFSPIAPKYFLLSPLFGLAILTLALAEDWLTRLPGRRAFVLLGEASYALYILHMPLLVLYEAAGKPFPSLILGAFILATSILAHLFIEEPARKAIRNRWGLRGRRKTSAAYSTT